MNNPQAFPHGDPTHGGEQGMTLHDYFAAKAMQGLLTAETVGGNSNEHVVEISYWIADAMMKAREA